jgi:gas vesicle structural protein
VSGLAVHPTGSHPAAHKDVALVDLVDRILTKGVVVHGDITLSVAGVDLVYLGLRVLLASADTAERLRAGAGGAGQT